MVVVIGDTVVHDPFPVVLPQHGPRIPGDGARGVEPVGAAEGEDVAVAQEGLVSDPYELAVG